MLSSHATSSAIRRRLLPWMLAVAACALSLVAPRADAQSAAYTLLHTFAAEDSQGANPEGDGAGRFVQGNDGYFYGAATYGGTNSNGTIFKMTPAGVVTVLYTFSAFTDYTPGDDGINTDGASPGDLTLGSDGNFYGTTAYGGTGGIGTIFKITPAGVLTVLHSFDARDATSSNNAEGYFSGTLVQGNDGNFYNTNYFGGTNGDGTVYRVTPTGVLTVLYTFSASDYNDDDQLVNGDGVSPNNLVLGADGNFYSTTYNGGATGNGTIFKITPAGVLTNLHVFDAFDAISDSFQSNTGGALPNTGLTQGDDGNFYGTAYAGGPTGYGTVFRVTPGGTLTVLHNFSPVSDDDINSDGSGLYDGLTKGADGNLYGVTSVGGSGGTGVIFQITPAGAFATLYNFSVVTLSDDQTGLNTDGSSPDQLLLGSDGNFYGTTFLGGANGTGTIFKFAAPAAHLAFFAGEVALGEGVYYLKFPTSGKVFGYYTFLSDPRFVYHFDMGFEYVIDAADGHGGVYLYDFTSNTFFYTSPTFPFPYLYDFGLQAFLYYFPNPNDPDRYNTNGVRYFYNFSTNAIITK